MLQDFTPLSPKGKREVTRQPPVSGFYPGVVDASVLTAEYRSLIYKLREEKSETDAEISTVMEGRTDAERVERMKKLLCL